MIQLGQMYSNHRINNDDLLLGASANAIRATLSQSQQPTVSQKNKKIGSGDPNKAEKGGRGRRKESLNDSKRKLWKEKKFNRHGRKSSRKSWEKN